jgi:hypothetical protein
MILQTKMTLLKSRDQIALRFHMDSCLRNAIIIWRIYIVKRQQFRLWIKQKHEIHCLVVVALSWQDIRQQIQDFKTMRPRTCTKRIWCLKVHFSFLEKSTLHSVNVSQIDITLILKAKKLKHNVISCWL